MNRGDMHTYTSIRVMYNRRRRKPAIVCTLDQVREMCKIMENLLPGTKLQVEPIGGGGIEFVNEHYKSIRFLARHFPWIEDPQTTKGSFYLTKGNTMSVFLKAFNDAPPFTENELLAYFKALNEVVLYPFFWKNSGRAGWNYYDKPCMELAKYYRAKARSSD